MIQKIDTTHFMDQFENAKAALPGPWLSERRLAAMHNFGAHGFPTTREEDWKYTNLSRLGKTTFESPQSPIVAGPIDLKDVLIAGAQRLVIRNGAYDPLSSSVEMSADAGFFSDFSAAVEDPSLTLNECLGNIASFEEAPLVALNTAFMEGGFVLIISDGVTIDRPIQIIHFVDCPNTDFVVHPRNLIVAGDDSSVEVVETYLGSINSRYWTNAVTEIRVGQNATVSHLKRQSETKHAYHTARTQVYLDQGADYRSVTVATGAELSRNEISVVLGGSGAKCMLAGGSLIRGSQHCDNTTKVDHRVPDTSSCQVFRNVLDDKSRSVFQGGIIVRPNAQKTNGSQSSRSLLLAAGAQANTKPELKIFADDVKCAHGATVGELDQDALFYLQSRGLSVKEAKSLLIQAFVNETLSEVRDDILRDHLFDAVVGWMNVAGESNG